MALSWLSILFVFALFDTTYGQVSCNSCFDGQKGGKAEQPKAGETPPVDAPLDAPPGEGPDGDMGAGGPDIPEGGAPEEKFRLYVPGAAGPMADAADAVTEKPPTTQPPTEAVPLMDVTRYKYFDGPAAAADSPMDGNGTTPLPGGDDTTPNATDTEAAAPGSDCRPGECGQFYPDARFFLGAVSPVPPAAPMDDVMGDEPVGEGEGDPGRFWLYQGPQEGEKENWNPDDSSGNEDSGGSGSSAQSDEKSKGGEVDGPMRRRRKLVAMKRLRIRLALRKRKIRRARVLKALRARRRRLLALLAKRAKKRQ